MSPTRHPSPLRILGRRLTLAAMTLALLGCPVASSSDDRLPDVVLVTLDTTRADRLGCYGDTSARTPTLDGLAASGLRFARALTPAPLTLPAHASLMTGLEPPDHGIRDNGLAALPSDLPTLAGTLSQAGYATGAVIASGVLDHRFGLDRGFDSYDDRLTAEYRGEYGYPERDAAAVTDAALGWVRTLAPDAPYFLWVHYYDPHAPYLPHGSADASEAARYANEISYVDRHLGRLLGALPGDSEQRLIAVVGDHGEMLGEHGERAHGLLLYRASLEVPLIVRGPAVPSAEVIETTVAASRLAASLLGLLGIENEAFGSGLPGLGGAAAEPEPVYSETWLPATAYGWSRMLALSQGPWRYVQAPRPELYDFVADPAEAHNLVAEQPRRAARMLATLAGFAPDSEGAAAEESASTPEDAAELQAQLRALGYLSGMSGDASDPQAGDGIDPKDGIAMLSEFEEAKRLLSAGDVWTARTRLDDLVRRNPSNVPFIMRAADARLASGDIRQGLALIRRAIELNPLLDLSHQRLAEALLQTGDLKAADAAFAEALELNPRLAGAWLGRAQIAAMSGDQGSERELLRQAVAAGTLSGGIFTRLGQLALADGEWVVADARLKQATDLLPHLVPAWWSWGQVAERQGDLPLAAERYARAVELNPRDAATRLHLGRLLAQLGRKEEARRMLQAAAHVEAAGAGRGAAAGPEGLRAALYAPSSNLVSESGIDLAARADFVDLGDLALSGGPATRAEIEQAAAAELAAGGRLICLGGDHSVAYPLLRAYAAKYRTLTVVQLDAHPDLYDSFEGDRFSHACPFARVMEEGLVRRLVQVGIRTANDHQRQQAARFGVEIVPRPDWGRVETLALEGPVYLSIDLDGFDPAFAPGVAHPEAGGLTAREGLEHVWRAPGLVGADVVELNPRRDRSGITAALGAKLVKELAGMMLVADDG